MTRALPILIFLLLSVVSGYGQSTPPPASNSSADLKACEQAIDRLKAAEAKNAVYESTIAQLLDEIALHKRFEAELTASRDAYKKEAETRAQVNAGDTSDRILAAKVESLLREQFTIMNDDRDRLLRENEKLRNPSIWRTLFDPRTLAAGFVGYGIGTITRH